MSQQPESDPFEILRFKRACMLQINIEVDRVQSRTYGPHFETNGVEGVEEMHVGHEEDGGAENHLALSLAAHDGAAGSKRFRF